MRLTPWPPPEATHHFDLVNWWLASKPVTVMAMGDLDFYGN
jgi:hypothetical protein